jgi:hypothetical protein
MEFGSMLVNAEADSELGAPPGEPGSLISNIFEAIVQVLGTPEKSLGYGCLQKSMSVSKTCVPPFTSFSIASKKAFSNLVDSLLQGYIGNGV